MTGFIVLVAGIALFVVGQLLAVDLVRALGGALFLGGMVSVLLARLRRE